MYKKQDELGRFSDPSLLILASLASGPKHGYAMMEDVFQFCGTFGVWLLPFITKKWSSVPSGVGVAFGLKLAHAFEYINNAGDQGE